MDEQMMRKIMTIVSIVVACVSVMAAVAMLVMIPEYGWSLVIPAVLLIGCTVAGVYGAGHYGQQISTERVFPNELEREVLTWRQRRELRTARGGLVMRRALVDIQNEEDNIVHRQIEASKDPDKPPHKTTLSPDPTQYKGVIETDDGGYIRSWDYER